MLESGPMIVLLLVGSLLLACLFAVCHAQMSKKRRARRKKKELRDSEDDSMSERDASSLAKFSKNLEIPFPFGEVVPSYQPSVIASNGLEFPNFAFHPTERTGGSLKRYEHVLRASTLSKVPQKVTLPRPTKYKKYATTSRTSTLRPKSTDSNLQKACSKAVRSTKSRTISKSASTFPPFHDLKAQQSTTLPRSILKSPGSNSAAISIPEETKDCRDFTRPRNPLAY